MARSEREANIRQHSEAYGLRVCTDHAHRFGQAIVDWRAGDRSAAEAIAIRAYNRPENAMHMTSLAKVLDVVRLGDDGVPERLTPTRFGQVMLTPAVHISTVIYHTLCAAWTLKPA